jgi:PKD repeat protein
MARVNGAEHMVRATRTLALLLTVALAAGCSVKNTPAPALSGPSELGLSLTLAASPDILSQDGVSQSQVIVLARDSNGRALANVALRLEVVVGGVAVDYGTLSSKALTTGADGRATAVYTAPRAPAIPVESGTVVTVQATPVGSNYASSVARTVDIRLMTNGTIVPPSDLVAGFVFSPDAPVERDSVVFTAQACSGAVTANCSGGSIASYSWSFGDGATASGQMATHDFAAGTWPVTLTVRDSSNRAASTTRTLTVKAGANPTASFVVSPSSPLPGQTVFFNAAASQGAGTRTLVDYQWTFGDGATGRGVTAAHAYDAKGAYTVVLTVFDDAGRYATSTSVVTVGAAALPTATFTITTASRTVTVDATGSSAVSPATIVSYDWDFGDGNRASGPVATHLYGGTGTAFAITLTVTDSKGNVTTTVKSVTF